MVNMNKKKFTKWITAGLIAVLTLLGLGQTMAQAIEAPEGPLTNVVITKVKTTDAAKDMTLEDLRDGVNVAEYFTDGEVLPGVAFTYFSVSDTQLATMNANPAAYDTVDEVEALVGAGTTTAETDANGQVTIPNLPEGNYWVVENTKGTIASSQAVPFGLTLPFTNVEGTGYLSTINVYPKNTLQDVPTEGEKEVNEPNVAIGQENTWTINQPIPVGIEDYKKFTVYDVIDSKLDFLGVENVVVAADGATFVKDTDYTVEFNTTTNRLDVAFTTAGFAKLATVTSSPKKVKISFKTKVNDTAVMGQEIPNKAVLEFDNSNGTIGSKETNEVSVHTGGKAFVKTDGAQGTLANAEFKIRNAQGQFVNVGTGNAITFGTEAAGTVFTSDANGKFEIKGLPYGTYVLVETKAPAGYALPTNPETEFIVNAVSYVQGSEQNIVNKKVTIPQTGGIGTLAFTVIGAILMILSIVFYKKTSQA